MEAVQDTYNRAFKEWKTNTVYLTELVIVLNKKIWQHYEQHNEGLTKLYDTLWRQTEDYAFDHLTGDDLEYYIQAID